MTDADLPRRQRIGAYAVIVRDGQILLARLAPWLSEEPLWALPGGGVEFGEDPHDAVVREVHEETGLAVTVGDTARVYSVRNPHASSGVDTHSVRIVYDGWVARDAPEPRVVEVDGSTVDAAWLPLADVASGAVSVTRVVSDALADHAPAPRQRLAAYALLRRDDDVLLTRISSTGAHPGVWTLPGGGVDHGESPATALVRELHEETGLEASIGDLLGVHDEHFTGTAPTGRTEDFHGVHLVFAGTVAADEVRVVEEAGTTDRVAWVPVAEVRSGAVPVTDVVGYALSL
jgi:8-oxo-dGTP diphosphatase